MTFILDTHCWLWWNAAPEKLGPESKRLISDPDNQVLFSVASIWEICIKHSIGKLSLPDIPKNYILPRVRENAFTILDIQALHAIETHELPGIHRDPFDRILIGQSRCEKLPIMTADAVFPEYGVPVIPAAE